MTDEQINAAIAEACGWKSKEETDGKPWLWVRTRKDRTMESRMEALPYCTNLNAMHEAEQVLISENQPARGCSQWGEYLSWLGYCGENNTSEVYACITASARHRAEAFLRTLGKWEEGK